MSDVKTLHLHEAIIRVLETCKDKTADYAYLASEINRMGLYHRDDGKPVPSSQISARVAHHLNLFEKIPANTKTGERARIRLK